MSAPRTNTEKEVRRHRGPLLGMAAVALFGVALIVYWIVEEVAQAPATTDDAASRPLEETAPVSDDATVIDNAPTEVTPTTEAPPAD